MALAGVVSWKAPGNDAKELAEIFRPALTLWAAEAGAELTADQEVEKLAEKIGRAQKALLLKFGAAEQARSTATSEFVARAAEAMGRPTDAVFKELVIQCGKAYYVFADFRYKAPIGREALPVSLPRDLSYAPISWERVSARGVPTPCSVDDLLREHATVARSIEADLALQRSWYDPVTEVFHEAACPRRPLAAHRHEAVEAWLATFVAPENLELLLDWLALLPDLTRQAPALYLDGPKSSGKSLFVHGLARLWTEGPPADVARVLSDFNDELTRCPLIFADEHIPQRFVHEKMSAKIRSLIGSGSRTLNRKFMPTAPLHGAARLVIAANNSELLTFGDEDIGHADIDAIAARVLYMQTTDAAVTYLDALGGPPVLNDWIKRDLIAQHVLWLHEERRAVLASKERFGIVSPITDMHRKLSIQGKSAALVADWLVKFLAKPEAHIVKKGGIYAADGHFYVNAPTIVEFWRTYLDGHAPLTMQRVGKILKNLEVGPTRKINGCVCRDLDVKILLRHAMETTAGDPEKIREFIARPGHIRADGTVTEVN
jgi:hypothetical protein